MKKLITTLAVLTVSATCLIAADAPKKAEGEKKHNPEEMFKKLDTNGDGSLSLDEFKAGPMGKKDPAKAEEMFKKRDTNGDGKLSLDEWNARHEKGAAPKANDPAAVVPKTDAVTKTPAAATTAPAEAK